MHNGMAKVGDTVYRLSFGMEYQLYSFIVTDILKGLKSTHDCLYCKCIDDGHEEKHECIYYHLSAKTAWQTIFDIEDKAIKYMEQQVKLKIKTLEKIKREIEKL